LPIPKSITQLNKHVTNRLFLHFAGWLPPLAIIEHRGRKSGRRYRTPILAFPTNNGYIFALTYGRNVDWVKNLRTSGSGVLRYNASTEIVYNPRFVPYEKVKQIFPGPVRLFLEILHITDCISIEKEGPVE